MPKPKTTSTSHDLDATPPKGWKHVHSGKVRELYVDKTERLLLMYTSDRVSAFDRILGTPIPHKGACLSLLSGFFLSKAADVLPTWLVASLGRQWLFGMYLKPLPIECVVRAHLSGSLWRAYQQGERNPWGMKLPEGMVEHQTLDELLFSPTTKGEVGQADEPMDEEAILSTGLLDKKTLAYVKEKSLALFDMGTEYAKSLGLRLLDAKYEFGTDKDGKIHLIDELHTPDSARYCEEADFQAYHSQAEGSRKTRLKHLSKESLREALLAGNQAGTATALSPEQQKSLSQLYVWMYEKLRGQAFEAYPF